MKLPIRIYLDLQERVEDTLRHSLDFSVVANEVSKTVVVIESNFFRDPKIINVEKNGLIMLDHDLFDQLLIKVFKLAVAEMRAADGDAIDWTISDLTRWIHKQFSAADAAAIEHVLSNFEQPKLIVQNRAEIRID